MDAEPRPEFEPAGTRQLNFRLPADLYRSLLFVVEQRRESLAKFFEHEVRLIVQREAESALEEAMRQRDEANRYVELLGLVARDQLDVEQAARAVDASNGTEAE